MKYYISIIIPLLLLTSCSRNNKYPTVDTNAVIAHVDDYPFDPPKLFESREYIDSVKFIRLETTRDCLVAAINEVFFTDEYIIVVDAKAASLFFFDLNGKYSHKIHRRGRGPGEYLKIMRAMVDEQKETVFVYDSEARKLISYDFYGRHLRTINDFSGGSLVRDIINLPSGAFLCYKQDGGDGYLAGLWKVDQNGVFEEYLWEMEDVYPLIFTSLWYNLYRLPDNKVGFIDQNLANIYSIENDVIYKRVEFEMPDKTMTDYAGVRETEKSFIMVVNSQEKGDYIFTDWIAPDRQGFKTAFSKSKNTVETGLAFSPFLGENMIYSGAGIRNNTENIHLSSVLPSTVQGLTSSKYPDEYRTAANKLLNGMPEEQILESNPILQLLFIKTNL